MDFRVVLFIGMVFLGIVSSPILHADESDLIKADRQALLDANASGSSSKIIAAKEQLSDDLGREADERRKDLEGVIIPLAPDGQGHLVADVLINGTIPASLIVDTGSPVVMLTSAFIQKLGIEPAKLTQGYVELLNGKYKAVEVTLDSLSLDKAHAQGISATVLLQDNKDVKDGLLGMSFLSKFHFTLDQTGQRLILKKLES